MVVKKQVADDYAIVATDESSDERVHVLKLDDTFAVLDRHGDIRPGGLGQLGLYSGGTRRLSRLDLSVGGHRPMLLSSTVTDDNTVSVADLTNPDVLIDGGELLRHNALHLHRSTVVERDALHCQLTLRSYALEPVSVSLGLRFDADFADVFEVRGSRRPRRGQIAQPRASKRTVVFSYHGLDSVVRSTLLSLDPEPDTLTGTSASWSFVLAPGAHEVVTIAVSCEPSLGEPRPHGEVVARTSETLRERAAPLDRIRTTHEQLDACLRRAAADLSMMLVPTAEGLYPHAGVPWFSTPFGRDGIITALELLWLHPTIAAGVLRFLAATQATTHDAERDAEPGKILHETRCGEMASLGEIPFGRYYGSVDATPLFVFLAGAYFRRTDDRALIEELWPHLIAALEWIDRHGDLDGDGFVEYSRKSEHGLRHQGWKDSEDSVFDAQGRLVDGPIALAEVQAYVYGAKSEAAHLAEAFGEDTLCVRVRGEAERLRVKFEEIFWSDELGTYALALDGAKQPCLVSTSNAGQCLLTGIVSEERARQVASRMLAEDLFSGWGVRTASTRERRYNPISYHNGTVWPHDNALIAAGFSRYGLTSSVLPIFEGQLEAASWTPIHRLPELFCGFERRPGLGPTLYPVACAPQAWAAGAPYLLLAAALGLEVSARDRLVTLRRPRLPASVGDLRATIEVGEASVQLNVSAHDGEATVSAHTTGGIEVKILL